MKVLITGGSGQLGCDLEREIERRFQDEYNLEIYVPSSNVLDITSSEAVRFIEMINPDIIFHCAAYTAVDKAEKEYGKCYSVNVLGTENVLKGAKKSNAKLIYISTDYVFDGKKDTPYKIDDEVNPINVYGKTKYLGEKIVSTYDKSFIVRTSWVFGINGNNFVKTMLKLASEREEINVVADQIGSPTYTVDLASRLVDLAETDRYGTYHINNEGYTSWYEFAKYIFFCSGKKVKVNPVETKDYKTDAKRPMNSCLDRSSLTDNGFDLLPSWQHAVMNYIDELKYEEKDTKKLEKKI